MDEQKVMIKIKSEEKDKLIIENFAGEEETYYLSSNNRSMRLYVDNFQVSEIASVISFVDEGEELPTLPNLGILINGTANFLSSFFKQGSLSVIGNNANKLSTLNITLRNIENLDPNKPHEKEKAYCAYGKSFLGFDENDGYFLECYISSKMLGSISSAILNNLLRSMRISLCFKEIYTKLGPYANTEIDTDWFLKPDLVCNTVNPIIGSINSINLSLAQHDDAKAHDELHGEGSGDISTGIISNNQSLLNDSSAELADVNNNLLLITKAQKSLSEQNLDNYYECRSELLKMNAHLKGIGNKFNWFLAIACLAILTLYLK